MNNQFAVRLQSGEATKPNTSINSGMIMTAAKVFNEESDGTNVIDVLNDKDIIILNDSEFSLVPTSSPGDLVNYDQIDRIDPVIVTAKNDTPTVTRYVIFPIPCKQSSTTQPPVPNNHLPPPIITINQSQPTSSSNDHPTLPSSSIFNLPANPLVPISTTVTTNAQNETVTTTNYEIVNPVSIPDVSGGEEGPLFAGVFDATFSDEQMQQLLDATEITVAHGGDGVAVPHEGIQQAAQSLQICNASSSTSHQAFKDITNTHHNGAVNINNPIAPSSVHGLQFCLDGTPNGYLTTPAATSDIAENAFGTEPMDGITDYSMLIKTEGLPSLDDFDVPHFIKQRYVDGKQAKIWQCGVCEKEFGHQYVLMRHLPTHTDERKFQCTVCGKAFRQMSTLSQHRAIHSADRPYICEICEKTFNRVSTLISHRKTHTGLKPHQCHLCNKAFHQKGNLRNHIFTHTNERPYKCDVCQKGFNQMSNLMCHKLKAHKRADKPKYNCQTCGKEFQKRMGLRNHEQYEHGDNGSGVGGNPAQRIKYTNGVLIDRINTAAMQLAIDTNEIPFALLRPLNGIPVLVRALPAGEKQLLVPATADDLKRHGHITIGGKPNILRVNQENNNVLKQGGNLVDIKAVDNDNKENKNSKVQIRIPVVATVVQRMDKDGVMRMDVQSPGPTPIENYGPNELITQMGTAKPLSQNETNQEHFKDVVNVEAVTLLKPEPTTQLPSTDDNMDVEEPSNSSNRIIERSLAKAKIVEAAMNDDSVICDYFDLTANVSDAMNDKAVVSGADGKKSVGDAVDQFDSGVFVGGDRDQSYCEMFEILRKDDDVAAIDLTEDDNPVAF